MEAMQCSSMENSIILHRHKTRETMPIAFVDGDVTQAAKGLLDFAKANPLLVIKGGVLDGKALTAAVYQGPEATPATRRTRRGTNRSAEPHPVSYTVQPGDSLATISARFEVSVAQLSSWNRLGDSHLRPGQKLIVHNDKGRDNGG